MFVSEQERETREYQSFWKRLRTGEAFISQFKRIGKQGQDIWIEASYNPILDHNGNVSKVIKFATDITADKIKNNDFEGKMDAINRSQAVIEFNMDGTIITANENFLEAVEYRLDEITGQHHKIFVDKTEADSVDYREFWNTLRKGKFVSGQFKRVRKSGADLWIEASYNPIFNDAGVPIKVVKFASDMTTEKEKNAHTEGQIAAIHRAQAVIEFELDGTIITANENFLNAVRYSLPEIQGKHHSIFVDPKYAASADYKNLWQSLRKGQFSSGQFKRFTNSPYAPCVKLCRFWSSLRAA